MRCSALLFLASLLVFAGDSSPLPSKAQLKKLPPDGGPKWNRLVFQSSPYLLAHAAQAIDWYPWGEEVFQRARREQKPIFLSIGYFACHWCHVMSRESFENAEIAALLNRDFFAIKLDREERPDLDAHFMRICQAATGQGGWPLTLLMTPDKQVFFVGTYFPSQDRGERLGLHTILTRIGALWREDRGRVQAMAANLVLSSQSFRPSEKLPIAQAQQRAASQLERSYDTESGGFGPGPKFPNVNEWFFLLRHAQDSRETLWLDRLERSLTQMREGGIYDRVGGGFHRYTSDRHWRVPHFEKMLSDQALLALLYLEAFQASGRHAFAQTVRETLDYLLERLQNGEGGLICSESAESAGEEGSYYLWSEDDLRVALGGDAEPFLASFGFRFPGDEKSRYLPVSLRDPAALSQSEQEAERAALQKLKAWRQRRVPPARDDKVLASWNGLAIAALARAGAVLEEPRYLEAARRVRNFVMGKMIDRKGRLWRVYRGKPAPIQAQLEDYAALTWGLLELYQAQFKTEDLRAALLLQSRTNALFSDDGLRLTLAQEVDPLAQFCTDGATPSGISMTAHNLFRLARLSGATSFEEQAQRLLERELSRLETPTSACFLLAAGYYAKGKEIVLVGPRQRADFQALERTIRARYLPNSVLLRRPDRAKDQRELAAFSQALAMLDGKATAYVCGNFVCKKPTTNPKELEEQLNERLRR